MATRLDVASSFPHFLPKAIQEKRCSPPNPYPLLSRTSSSILFTILNFLPSKGNPILVRRHTDASWEDSTPFQLLTAAAATGENMEEFALCYLEFVLEDKHMMKAGGDVVTPPEEDNILEKTTHTSQEEDNILESADAALDKDSNNNQIQKTFTNFPSDNCLGMQTSNKQQ